MFTLFKSTAIMCTLVQTPLSETIQNVKQCVEMENVCFKYTAIMFTLATFFFQHKLHCQVNYRHKMIVPPAPQRRKEDDDGSFTVAVAGGCCRSVAVMVLSLSLSWIVMSLSLSLQNGGGNVDLELDEGSLTYTFLFFIEGSMDQ